MSSSDHQALVDEFKAITDTSEDDKITRLLEVHEWNLNNAVLTFFESGFIQESAIEDIRSAPTPATEDEGFSTAIDHEDSVQRRYSMMNSFEMHDLIPKLPFAPRISNNWQLEIGLNASRRDRQVKAYNSIWFILLLIPNKILSVVLQIFRYIFKVNYSNTFPKEIDYELLDLDYKATQSIPDHENFNIAEHDYNAVYEDCRQNYKWLLVVLINNSDESHRFVNGLFQNHHFAKLFSKDNKDADSCIYINNVDKNPESFEIGKAYKAKNLPYIMLINNVSNHPQVMSSMSIVYKSNISPYFLDEASLDTTCTKITKNLTKLIDRYQPQIITAVADKKELEFARMIKQKQDDAYQKSLEVDRLKKIEKQQKQEQEHLKQQRKAFLKKLELDQWFEKLNENSDMRIQIKLPHGERVVLQLNGDIKLKQLYLFVEAKLTEQDEESEEVTLTEDEYYKTFQFNFELVQPFPKQAFGDLDSSINEHIKSGASLLVEYVDSDSDDDST